LRLSRHLGETDWFINFTCLLQFLSVVSRRKVVINKLIVIPINNYYIDVMKNTPALSIASREALSLLAARLELARREHGMTQMELAERAGISINTLKSVLQGRPQVAIGTVFEVAAILQLSLHETLLQNREESARPLSATSESQRKDKALLDARLKLLPRRVHRQKAGIDDDF
jgi:transcriptional regulator with XRE-family HTH domain